MAYFRAAIGKKKKVTTESDLEFMSSYSLLICIIQRFAKKNGSPPTRRVTLIYRASPQKTSEREIYFMAEESMVEEATYASSSKTWFTLHELELGQFSKGDGRCFSIEGRNSLLLGIGGAELRCSLFVLSR